jgi:hypothetical protein
VNHDVSWAQRVNCSDFDPIRIVPNVRDFHPLPRTRAAKDDTVIWIERPETLMHRLLPIAKLI